MRQTPWASKTQARDDAIYAPGLRVEVWPLPVPGDGVVLVGGDAAVPSGRKVGVESTITSQLPPDTPPSKRP